MSSIFISSTFQDMQQERDVLQTQVLPKVKEFAKQYGKNIDLCDLRWGVNSLGMNESESAAKVLQVCFDEIDNARPFFIAILGDRYGWIPDPGILGKSTIGRELKTDDLAGKSVTEMEIIYGALKNTGARDVRFYFRDIKNKKRGLFPNRDLPECYISKSSDDKARMSILKEKIKESFSDCVRTYSVVWNNNTSRFDGMDAFAQMLYQDITDMIVQNWGEIPALSEYEYQYNQYQYAMACDNFFNDESEPLFSSGSHPDNLMLNEKTMHKQNYVLVSRDERSLNILFSSLCERYKSAGAQVIPYECSQSVLSSSSENMIRYFTDILARSINNSADIGKDESGNHVKRFYAALDRADVTSDKPVILAVRNIQYLDVQDVFEWLPVKKYKNVHFIVSCGKMFSGSSQFKDNTSVFYFSDNKVFSRNRMIKSYMSYFHKEIDRQVYYALMEKADGKDNQYLELLMQRILFLSQNDFEVIRSSGDGMEKISMHLQKIISESPDNTAEIVLAQLSLLEKETEGRFAKAVLGVLSVLPYGISMTDLAGVLKCGGIEFNRLDMTLLCRRLPFIVNVTLDGYYRMIQSPVTKIISDFLISESFEWCVLIEKYMNSEQSAIASTDTKKITNEFYRSQYPEVALRAKKRNALSGYLKEMNYETSYISIVLYRILLNKELKSELIANFGGFSTEDVQWIVNNLYDNFSANKMLLNKDAATVLIDLWKAMLFSFEKTYESSENNNYILFKILYELGEMSYIHDIDSAADYLLRAKSLSKENFRQYPNRPWKMLHGIELTEEEKHRGYDSLDIKDDISSEAPVMFAFQGEIEDMEFEQSWSPMVRIINNYLSQIYRKKGDFQAAERLESESKKLTHISDPDPLRQGNKNVADGITLVWPDELDGTKSTKKHAYKPDMRRNSAIQMAKEARRLSDQGKYKEAVAKYEESNGILKEIYEDGKTGEYYDLFDVDGDIDGKREMIQKECARDLGLNYNNMVFCVTIDASNEKLLRYMDEMLRWAHIYDDYRNNRQSKEDLEYYYMDSATIYSMFDDTGKYYERIIHDIDKYFTYRLEAYINGERTNERIIECIKKANDIFFRTVTENPRQDPQITDLLLRQSNASVKANDFNGYLLLTRLAESLLRWAWENSFEFIGTYCSLEDICITNINNQCSLWENENMTDNLKQDSDRLIDMLHNVRNSENVLKCIQSILSYAIAVFRTGRYKETLPYADAIFNIVKEKNSLPDMELAHVYENLLAMYSEAEIFDKAHTIAMLGESLLEQMEHKDFSEVQRLFDITPSQYKSFVISKRLIIYLNYAILLSRMGKAEEGYAYILRAEVLASSNPEAVSSQPGIMKRIELFKKNGLPVSKAENDSEKEYRKYKERIETILGNCLQGKPYDVLILREAVNLIGKMVSMPEHEIFKSPVTVANYYFVLNMLFVSRDRKDLAVEMLKRACEIADNDERKNALYGDIYSDMCAYTESPELRLEFMQKALSVYEYLQKNGEKFSQNSYAMALHNAAIILMGRKEYGNALSNAKKALYIWEKLLLTEENEQIKAYVTETQRLVVHLETNMN